MALLFTDEQIRETTGQILAAPQTVIDLKAGKDKVIVLKQDFKDLDDSHTVYTNNYSNIINRYHAELKNLTGAQKTDPDLAKIVEGGKLSSTNIYFPVTPTPWTKFQPMVNPENNGNPSSSYAANETTSMSDTTVAINLMKVGFSDGSASALSTAAGTANEITIDTVVGFSVGNRVLVTDAAQFAFGTISGINGSILTISVTTGSLAGMPIGAVVKNFHSGFTLSQRETHAGVSGGELQYLLGLKASIDTKVTTWKTALTAQQNSLNLNDATGVEKPQIDAAKLTILAALADITAWQALPITGAGTSRFGNNIDTYITSRITTRGTQSTARAAEITAALGAANQDGDGNITGSGNYLKMMETTNIRINKTGGTLRNYYQQDLAIASFDQKIAMAQAAMTRDNQVFSVKELSADAMNTGIIKLKDVAGLTNGQAVKIMSNTKPVINATITNITDLEVQLSASIASDYTVSEKARLVIQL